MNVKNLKNYYEILEISRKASKEEVKLAFRRLAKIYHPDANVNNKEAEEKFKLINEAYAVLENEASRKKYDKKYMMAGYAKDEPDNGDVKYEFKKGTKAVSEFINLFFGSEEAREENNDEPIRGRKKKNSQADKVPLRGENVESEMQITLEEGFCGVEKKIALRTNKGIMKSFSVSVPEGIRNNEKIRLAGLGKPGVNGGKNGDLLIKIKILKHNEYELDGCDIVRKLKLTPWDAALGCTININGIDNEPFIVNIPQGICSSEKVRIAGKGYKLANKTRGAMILDTEIIIPKELNDDERKLFERLREISEFEGDIKAVDPKEKIKVNN